MSESSTKEITFKELDKIKSDYFKGGVDLAVEGLSEKERKAIISEIEIIDILKTIKGIERKLQNIIKKQS